MGKANESTCRVVTFTPTVDTAIYASGDQLGSLVEIPNFVDEPSGFTKIVSLSGHDKAAQSSIMQVLFFRDRPTVTSVDNAALNISDAEMADKCIGHVSIVAGDYFALSASSMGCVRNVQLVVTSRKGQLNLTGRSVWAIIRCGGTPTYASTTDLVFTVGLENN
jgi:hypothetical protein